MGVLAGSGSCCMFAMWDHWYGVLAKLVRAQGPVHALRVAGPHAEHLEDFIAYNRRMAARNALPKERVMLLDRLGFIWDAAEAIWTARYDDMVAWHAEHGTFVVPRRENPTLAQWTRNQRSLETRGLLSPRRTQLLKLVGFPLEPINAYKWNERYDQLVSFHKSHGRVQRITAAPDGTNRSLARWLRLQRRLHRNGTLAPDRARRLEALDVLSKPVDDAWNQNFKLLVNFKKAHGHTEVPQRPGLGQWIHKQRSEYNARKLSPARQRRLDEIGFSWNAREAKWERRFQELTCYYNERPLECRGRIPKEDAVLVKWLENQHLASNRKVLSQARSAKLASIGIRMRNV